MRKLASIKEIKEINSIEGKDRIVQAIIDGWSLIVKKDEFKVGDRCIYIEIDSVLPEKPEYEFLRSKNFRIKTLKMAGVISQGIAFPLSFLPERKKPYELDEDVTEILGVTQYEPTRDVEKEPIKKSWLMRFKWYRNFIKPKVKGFPDFISKTDETRIQNIPHILKDKDTRWVITEKIDGQSGTFVLIKHKILFFKWYEFIVCSRNQRNNDKNSSYWFNAKKYNIENVLKQIIGKNEWVAIQGENIGPKIQGNKYNTKEPDLYVFNLIYPEGRINSISAWKYLETFNIKFVPIIYTNYKLPDTVQEMLDLAHGKSVIADIYREGLVLRSEDGKQSFKAVDPLFLLKYDE